MPLPLELIAEQPQQQPALPAAIDEAPFDPAQFGAVEAEDIPFDPTQFGAVLGVNKEKGAPIGVRIAVGASKSPGDKLATLKGHFPDAMAFGQDNFIYTDPESGEVTLYNPEGLDLGDIQENGRIVWEMVGGTLGATAAAVGGQMGPQILAPEEIVTVPLAAGAGAAFAGQAYDAVTQLMFPYQDTQSFLERAALGTTDFLLNATGQRAADIAGKALSTWKNSMIAGTKKGDQGLINAFESMGVKPTGGLIAPENRIARIEAALSKAPGGSEIIGKEQNRVLDGIAEYSLRLSKGWAGPEGRELAGMGIKEGAEKFVQQFKATAGKLYDEVDTHLPPGAKTKAANLGDELTRIVDDYKDNPAFKEVLVPPSIRQLLNAYNASVKPGEAAKTVFRQGELGIMERVAVPAVPGGGITYKTLKALRTDLGNSINDKALIGDVNRAQKIQLYNAISDDMMELASATSPEALQKITRANSFWKAGRSRIDDLLQPVVNKKLNQDVFQAAISKAKGGPQTLNALKKSLPKEDWDNLVAAQIAEMGVSKANGGAFSAQQFFNNFSLLSKSGAAKSLFSDPRHKGLEVAMDNLAKSSEALLKVQKLSSMQGPTNRMNLMFQL